MAVSRKKAELEELLLLESKVSQKRLRFPRVEVKQVITFTRHARLTSTKNHVTCFWEDGSAYLGSAEDSVDVLRMVLTYLDIHGDGNYEKHKEAGIVYAALGSNICADSHSDGCAQDVA